MKLRYELIGTGWAKAIVETDGQAITMIASYLSDALLEMTLAAIAVLQGASEVRFSFDDEPGEYRWMLKSQPDGNLHLKILKFDELWSNQPDDRGTLLLEAQISRRQFCGQVAVALDTLKGLYGEKGYKEKWANDDFPSEKHQLLKQLLSN